ncbi:MAG: Smr/MutS family protein [Firmicutes bacterium]|nr:Smr/MutS family protein [Bacillota bacterium]MCL1953299.1 Smr/MutS family protein [Bacillota bacterium]
MIDKFEDLLPQYLNNIGDKQDKPTYLHNKKNPKKIVDDCLDVHGLTVQQAIKKLEEKLLYCSHHSIKRFRLIYGKGLHSPDKTSVLRQPLREYLDKSKFVSKVDPCEPKDGGFGAVWVVIVSK